MKSWVGRIKTGWVVREGVPGPDVDEFAEPDQITAALARPGAAQATLLAAQHPHRTPAALARNLSVPEALPIGRAALNELRAKHYRPVEDVVALSWGDGPHGSALGVLCIVDPAAVNPEGLTYVRHTEEVYPDVVAERAAMLSGLGCATSAAMLVPATDGAEFTELLLQVVAELGEPTISLTGNGSRDRMWLVGKGELQKAVLAAACGQSLLVADGNHRVAAATLAGKGSLLALVTGGPNLRIGPINRVLTGTGLGIDEMARRWQQAGLEVSPADDRTAPKAPGTVVVLSGEKALRVRLPRAGHDIDHRLVEHLMVERALGLDPAGPHVRPLPGGRVPRPDAEAVLLIAPVPLADVLAVHEAGERMPRKATYFTPKPRSGLLLADLRRTG